jgi:hypothetical protein
LSSVETRSLSSAHRWTAEYSFVTICVLLGLMYGYGQSNLNFIGFVSNIITPFEALAAFAIAALLWKMNSGKQAGGMSRVYASYSLGIGFWLLAECTWSLYVLAFRIEIPYPSIADLFWLVGYIPLLMALLLQAWPFRELLVSKKQLALTLGMFVLAFLILIATIPPLLGQDQDLVALGVSVAYPLLDTLLLTVAIPIFLVFRKGSYWRPLLFVTFGIILQLFGDLAFNQAFFSSAYYAGSAIDLIFDMSYLMLALGFYRALKPRHLGGI